MYVALSFIFWFMLGFVTCGQAENKGYNKWLGLIMGILFGIFAVYVYALLPDKNKKELFERIYLLEKNIKQIKNEKDLEEALNDKKFFIINEKIKKL